MSAVHRVSRAVVVVLLLALSGCTELWRPLNVADLNQGTTSAPGALNAPRPERPLGLAFRYNYFNPSDNDYFRNVYANAASDDARKAVRNSIIAELMDIVDHDYFAYERALRSDRAYKDLFVGITSIVLTATATGMGGGAATTLAAIDTGLKGSNALVDKTAFADQAPNILLNSMRKVRDDVAKNIYESMKGSVADYPLEEAIRDVSRYYNAGTVTAALIDLAAKTATESKKSSDDATTAKKALNAPPPPPPR